MRWFVLLLLWPLSAVAHPQHRSTAQVEVNRQRGVLEVGLRVLPGQLERAIEWSNAVPNAVPNAVSNAPVLSPDEHIARYLRARFRVTRKGRLAKLRWIGSEPDGAELWLYFEIELPDLPNLSNREVELSNRIFFELSSTQINVIQLRDGKTRRTVSQTLQSKPLPIPSLNTPIETRR